MPWASVEAGVERDVRGRKSRARVPPRLAVCHLAADKPRIAQECAGPARPRRGKAISRIALEETGALSTRKGGTRSTAKPKTLALLGGGKAGVALPALAEMKIGAGPPAPAMARRRTRISADEILGGDLGERRAEVHYPPRRREPARRQELELRRLRGQAKERPVGLKERARVCGSKVSATAGRLSFFACSDPRRRSRRDGRGARRRNCRLATKGAP